MTRSTAEFMRYTAPGPQRLAQGIAEQREHLARALAAGDQLAIVDHVADLAGLLTTDRRELEALPLLREHAEKAEALSGQEPAAWYWNAYATALQYAGHRAEAEPHFAKAVGLCAASGWTRLQAMALHHWGRSLVEQGRLDEAETRIREALALRVAMNDPRQELSQQALDALARLRG